MMECLGGWRVDLVVLAPQPVLSDPPQQSDFFRENRQKRVAVRRILMYTARHGDSGKTGLGNDRKRPFPKSLAVQDSRGYGLQPTSQSVPVNARHLCVITFTKRCECNMFVYYVASAIGVCVGQWEATATEMNSIY